MRHFGLGGRFTPSPRFVGIAAAVVACAGLLAVAAHHDARPTTLRAASGDDELIRRFDAPTSTAPFAGSANLTDPSTSTTLDGVTTTTTTGDGSVPPTTAAPTTSADPATTTLRPAAPTTTTTPPAPPCGAPPAPSSAVPPPGKALYWIENTSSLSSAKIIADGDGPHSSAPCSTIGPFSLTPLHDEPPTAGEDYVSVDQNPCAGYANDGGAFMHVGHSYVLKLYDYGLHPSCSDGSPPPTVLKVQVFDLATGQRTDYDKP